MRERTGLRLRLLGTENAKTVKGLGRGWMTGMLYLAHDSTAFADGTTVCPYSTRGCRAVCLDTAGRGALPPTRTARARKTRLFVYDRPAFLALLRRDLGDLLAYGRRHGLRTAARLNGTSDLPWEELGVMDGLAGDGLTGIRFYDYTKWPIELRPGAARYGYHLVYSVSESRASWRRAEKYLAAGLSAAVVFADETLSSLAVAEGYRGWPVVDGDRDDLRFLDRPGIVALHAKGSGRRDATGFIRRSLPVLPEAAPAETHVCARGG